MATTIKTQTFNISTRSGSSHIYEYRIRIVENSIDEGNNKGNYTIYFDIQSVSSTFVWYSYADSDATFRITSDAGANINADTKIRNQINIAYNSWTNVGSYTGDFAHNEDGTLTIIVNIRYGWTTDSQSLPAETPVSTSGTATQILRNPVLYIKVSGAWKTGKVYVKINGAWKQAGKVYTKESGSWKECALKG